jgi:hypothetical protein
MTTPNMIQDYSTLDEIFGVQDEQHVINENLLFNSDMLNRCREDCKQDISKIIVKYKGAMIDNQLQLVDIRTVHPAGKEITNNKTGEVLPKGFQVRADHNIDIGHKDAILNDIFNTDWNTAANTIVLFRLPKEYQYVNNQGIKVIWGILDGTHRYRAAADANQENIISWLVDMNIDDIYKFACAELNRSKYSAKSRTDRDTAAAILRSYKNPNSELFAKINNVEECEVNSILIEEIKSYNYDRRSVNAVLRIIQHDPDVTVDRKQYSSAEMKNYISEHKIDWIEDSGDNLDYLTKKGVRVILTQAIARNAVIVAHDICLLTQRSNAPIVVAFATDINSKLTPENAQARREQFREKVYAVIKDMGRGYKAMFEDCDAVNPSWLCFPELADEFADGMINLM